MVDWNALSRSLDIKQSRNKILATFDCETTGSNLHHDDLPFMISMMFETGHKITWQWEVDPFTRLPIVDYKEVAEIITYLLDTQYHWVGQNFKFDVRCIEKIRDYCWSLYLDGMIEAEEDAILKAFDPIAFIDLTDDTMMMSHAIDNRSSHGLKELCIKFLNISDDDQQEVKRQVEHLRPRAEKLGWKIANKANRPLDKKAPDGGWWKIDMWLPYTFYMYEKRNNPESVGEFTDYTQIYCEMDVERTLRIYILLRDMLEEQNLWNAYQYNQDLLAVSYDMERCGMPIREDVIDSEIARFSKIAYEHRTHAKDVSGYLWLNITSPQQVAKVLRDNYHLHIERETAGGEDTVNKDEIEIIYKFVESELESSKTPLVLVSGDRYYNENSDTKPPTFLPRKKAEELLSFLFDVLAAKKCEKAAETDLASYKKLAIDGKLHTSINLTATDTTRLSASNPNLTNVSKGKNAFNEEIKGLDLSLRKVFGPEEGDSFIFIDGKQLQVVIAAVTSGETELIEAIKRGDDMHETTHKLLAAELDWVYDSADDGQRTVAKGTNFGYFFGAGEKKINKTTRTTGLYPVLTRLFPNAHNQIKKDIRQVETNGFIYASKYRLFVPPNTPYAATVYKVQGWEGMIMKRAMRKVWEFLREHPEFDAKLLLCIHDELLFRCKTEQVDILVPLLVALMEEAAKQEGIPAKMDAKVSSEHWGAGVSWKPKQTKKIPPFRKK